MNPAASHLKQRRSTGLLRHISVVLQIPPCCLATPLFQIAGSKCKLFKLCTWGHSPVTPCRYKTSPLVPTAQTATRPSCSSIWIDTSRSLTWGITWIHGPLVVSLERLEERNFIVQWSQRSFLFLCLLLRTGSAVDRSRLAWLILLVVLTCSLRCGVCCGWPYAFFFKLWMYGRHWKAGFLFYFIGQ